MHYNFMNYYKFIIIIFIQFYLHNTFCQQNVLCKIIDANTKKNLQFCYLYDSKGNLKQISNVNGEFLIKIEEELNDSYFFCFGYDTLHFKQNIYSDTTFSLTPKQYYLKEVTFKDNRKKYDSKIIQKPIINRSSFVFKYYSNVGWLRTRLLLGQKKSGFLKSVFIYIADDEGATTKFRIRIFMNENGKPGNEITPYNIIGSGLKKGWVKINIDELVIFPIEGLFIGVEIIQMADNKPFIKEWGDNQSHTIVKSYVGPIIGGKKPNNKKEVTFDFSTKCNCWINTTSGISVPLIAAEVIFNKK